MKTTPAVAALVFKDDVVLLVKHGKKASHLTGVYGLPGGRLDEGEEALDTVIRELREETNLSVSRRDLQMFPHNVYAADIKRKDSVEPQRFAMTVYICRTFTGELNGGDETVPEWVKISKLDSYNLLPNVKKAVTEGLRYV